MIKIGKMCGVSDEYAAFFKHIPQERHYYGKEITFPIEQANCDIRHWLTRFIRQSKSTTRSVAMLAASITLMHAVQLYSSFNNIIVALVS
jgi:IS1 family transposase